MASVLIAATGLDFLTVLGAHEGEGLVVEADAEVAGSRSPWLADNGQRVRRGLSIVCRPDKHSDCMRGVARSWLQHVNAHGWGGAEAVQRHVTAGGC